MDEKQIKLTEKEKKQAHIALEKLFSLLGIAASFELEENESGLDIVLSTEDTGIIIGYHGEVLEALQLITSLILSKKADRFIRVSMEVGDYKKNRSEYLEQLAIQTKEKVVSEGKEHVLSSLRPWERRIVHLFLQNDDQVISESMGEGKDRVLVVKPKS